MRAYPTGGSVDLGGVRRAGTVIVPMSVAVIGDVERLMALGAPYVRARSASDYWLYATLFSSTCPVAIDDGMLVGAVVAMRSQDNPNDVYVQDVAVPDHRHRGVAATLFRGDPNVRCSGGTQIIVQPRAEYGLTDEKSLGRVPMTPNVAVPPGAMLPLMTEFANV